MRISDPVKIESISEVLMKPGCPLCAFLKNEQALLLKGGMRSEEVLDLCNFHAWAFAAVTDVRHVAHIFTKVLKRRAVAGHGEDHDRCSVCARILKAEVVQLKELLLTLQSEPVRVWMEHQGTLCVTHASHLRQRAPEDLHPVIDKIVARVAKSLEVELETLLRRSGSHSNSGGGALGRAAEFIVSQRGIKH